MARHVSFLGTLTIASGGTASNILPCVLGRQMTRLVLVGPAALTGTVTVYGSMNDADTPGIVAVNGTNQTVAAAKTQQYDIIGLKQVQVKSGSAEDADRTCSVYVEFDQ